MAAVLTVAAAAAINTAHEESIARDVYLGGKPRPASSATMNADYARMHAALVLVKADAAYSTLQAGVKTAVEDCGF